MEIILSDEMKSLVDMTKGSKYASACYPQLVEYLIRQKYNQSQVEALTCNYLDDNEKYANDFKALQNYRKECKVYAKELLEITD